MYTLYLGNKNYSSWSLRGWLAAKCSEAPFAEVMVALAAQGQPNPAARAVSPSGRVPCLHDGPVVVWDSLAIAEYLAERHPGMWPVDPAARAWARAIASEMHSGFVSLRNEMTMCIRERVDVRPWSPGLAADIARITAIWNEGRQRFASLGAYLCGRFSLADAFYAPVAYRFRTYAVTPEGAAGAYLRELLAHPWLCEWEAAALNETAIIDADEPRVIYRDKLAGEGGSAVTEPILGEWQARLRAAAAAKAPLAIRGGGTKAFYGETVAGEILDTRTYRGIIDYDPTELVMTARAGTPLDEIEAAMAAAGQMLAFEPPRFDRDTASAATLGGAIAAGLAGPRRPYGGAVRDLVLGVRILDGKGEDLAFGGRVMKNVAGFDVSRLMTGALGTLGVLLDISLKCLPAPKTEMTRLFECSAEDAIRRANEWGRRPLPVSATCYYDGQFSVRLSGAEPAVAAAAAKLGGDAPMDTESGPAFWRSVRDHAHPHFAASTAGDAPLWRLAVKSTAPLKDFGGPQLIEWGGGLRWVVGDGRSDAAALRAWAREHGGHATLFRATDKTPGVFHPLPAPVMALHRRLKAVFDPAGILNPGRLYPEF